MVRRILVIEDDEDIRVTLQALLETLPDVEVSTATGFQEGKALLEEGEAWDLVLSDERLPDGRGVDLLARSSSNSPSAMRVLMSAFHDFDMMLRAVNAAHIDHFMLKPYDPDHMLEKLEHLLQIKAQGKGRPIRSGPFRRIGSHEPPVARRELQAMGGRPGQDPQRRN